jgi:hypothetical protein
MFKFLLHAAIIITGLHATINSHHVTTVAWNQTQKAFVCIYNDHTLLFCKDFTAGSNTVNLGTQGPLVSHVEAGNKLTLLPVTKEVDTPISTSVQQKYELWMPLLNLTPFH